MSANSNSKPLPARAEYGGFGEMLRRPWIRPISSKASTPVVVVPAKHASVRESAISGRFSWMTTRNRPGTALSPASTRCTHPWPSAEPGARAMAARRPHERPRSVPLRREESQVPSCAISCLVSVAVQVGPVVTHRQGQEVLGPVVLSRGTGGQSGADHKQRPDDTAERRSGRLPTLRPGSPDRCLHVLRSTGARVILDDMCMVFPPGRQSVSRRAHRERFMAPQERVATAVMRTQLPRKGSHSSLPSPAAKPGNGR